jgi:dTDP-4-amino-4,6-dideoxy-D-galactose acyltransferase
VLSIQRDQWLSGVLAVPSWKVEGVDASTASKELRERLVESGDTAFLAAKIPTWDVEAVNNATQAGFRVIDVIVTFEWPREMDVQKALQEQMTVEAALVDDAQAVEDIAARSFRYTRFHLDPAIGQGRANEIKRQWARNACDGRASAVYVARERGHIVGFLAVMESTAAGHRDAIIDLIAVDAGSQSRGAGRALSRRFIDIWRSRSDRLRVGTQVANIPAMRLYESLGFRVAASSYVLHAHVKGGKIAE